MLFQGTATLDQVALNRRAAELGGEHNADTGYEDISLDLRGVQRGPRRRAGAAGGAVLPHRVRAEAACARSSAWSWRRSAAGSTIPASGSTAGPGRVCSAGRSPIRCRARSPAWRASSRRDVAGFLRRRLAHPNTVLAVVGGVGLDARPRRGQRHFQRGAPGKPAAVPPVRWGSGGRVELRDRDSSQAYLTMLLPVSRHRRARCSPPASRSTSSAPIPTAGSSRSCASGSASATRSAPTSIGGRTGRWPCSAPAARAAGPTA